MGLRIRRTQALPGHGYGSAPSLMLQVIRWGLTGTLRVQYRPSRIWCLDWGAWAE
jgi:hypothetical protein